MKSTYETMDGKYQQEGDYLLPNLEVPESPKVGVWGERRRMYLREHQKALYTAMMLSETKATNQMEWVQQMNNVRNRAAEVVWKELICA